MIVTEDGHVLSEIKEKRFAERKNDIRENYREDNI